MKQNTAATFFGSEAAIARLAGLPLPCYQRYQSEPAIVHLGAGGFHRAHQAAVIDSLLARGHQPEWTICAVGIREQDRELCKKLKAQECLYTLVERAGNGASARVIGSIVDYLLVPDEPLSVTNRLASRSTRIISMTITGAGYYLDANTRELNLDHPDVRHDLEQRGEPPRTMYGCLAAGFTRRLSLNHGPCTLLSCDNFEGNGELLGAALLKFAREFNDSLADWIECNVSFPNSMVDRITPVPNEGTYRYVRSRFGVDDPCAVITEPFLQWVIEDNFVAGRPNLEQAGARLTTDVRPYEKIKLRLLNASHSLICYLGLFAGFRFIHQIADDESFAAFALHFMEREAVPLLETAPGMDTAVYPRLVIERFGNQAISDSTSRICSRGSHKVPKFILPTVREQLAKGGSISASALAIAGWIRFLRGTDENGKSVEIEDPLAGVLHERALEGGVDPLPVLKVQEVFGNLAEDVRFTAAVHEALVSLDTYGVRGALSRLQAAG